MAPTSSELKNIQAIMSLERETLDDRSAVNRMTDRVSKLASSTTFVVGHVLWFAVWIGLNLVKPVAFDPFPFNLLTLVVSLEAIVLTGFVLMAQSRMTHQADRRAHLDLQINLLAEQELTAILRMQCRLAERAGIDVAACEPKLEQLLGQTDIRGLAAAVNDELKAVEGSTAHAPAPAAPLDRSSR
jgi:uncharacterized membrane protein